MSLRTLILCTLFAPLALADSPAATGDGKTHAVLRVDSVKPGLTRRDVLTLHGAALGEARGGWTYKADARIAAAKILVTVDASAAAGAVVAKNEAPFKTTVEVVELKDKKTGSYDVEVRGFHGDLLWSGTWVDGQLKDGACPPGEVVVHRGTRSQFCAPNSDGKCAPGRKGVVTPISGGQPSCVPEKP